MVGLDGLERCHSGEEGLPSAGVSCEVVGFDAGDDDESVRIDGDLVDLHGSTVLRVPEVHALGLLSIVYDDAVLEFLVVGSEHEVVFLLGHVPVGSGGDEVPCFPEIHPGGKCIEDLGGRGGACPVVDDEDDVLPSLEETLERIISDGCIDRCPDGLFRNSAFDVHWSVYSDEVLLRNLDGLNAVLAVPDVHQHFYRTDMCIVT